MINVHLELAPDGHVVTLDGAILEPGLLDALSDGLACLSDDGFVVVDLSGLLVLDQGLAARLLDCLLEKVSASSLRLVSSRLTSRRLYRRTGRPVALYASVADALASVSAEAHGEALVPARSHAPRERRTLRVRVPSLAGGPQFGVE